MGKNTNIPERFRAVKYGRWLWAIYDSLYKFYARKTGMENDGPAYDERGVALFMTFKNKSDAKEMCQKLNNDSAVYNV